MWELHSEETKILRGQESTKKIVEKIENRNRLENISIRLKEVMKCQSINLLLAEQEGDDVIG